jgi:hypothetical protein
MFAKHSNGIGLVTAMRDVCGQNAAPKTSSAFRPSMPSLNFLRFTPSAQRDHRTHAVAREESDAKGK